MPKMPSNIKERQKARDTLRRIKAGVTKTIRPSTRKMIAQFSDINQMLVAYESAQVAQVAQVADIDYAKEQENINREFEEEMETLRDKQRALVERRRVKMNALREKFQQSAAYKSFSSIQRGFENADDDVPLTFL